MFKDLNGTEWFYNALKRVFGYGLLGGFPDGTFRPNEGLTRAQQASVLDRLLHNPALRLSMQRARYELAKKLTPSVVTILAKDPLFDSLGSGVVLDKQGYIATNSHVIFRGYGAAENIEVYLDRYPTLPFKAVCLYADLGQDVAILKIGAPEAALSPVKFSPRPVRWLEDVVCIGSPLGIKNTCTMGVVSYEDRVIRGRQWIQIDTPINPGNSGGGAFNLDGEFVGLPTWKYAWADAEMTRPVEGMGFLSPASFVRQYYEQSKNRTSLKVSGEMISGFIVG